MTGRTFEVVRLDGAPLPASAGVAGDGGCRPESLARSTLAFRRDGTLEHAVWLASARGAGAQPAFRTRFDEEGQGSVRLWGDPEVSGRLRGDTLFLRIRGTLTCANHFWTAVERAAPE